MLSHQQLLEILEKAKKRGFEKVVVNTQTFFQVLEISNEDTLEVILQKTDPRMSNSNDVIGVYDANRPILKKDETNIAIALEKANKTGVENILVITRDYRIVIKMNSLGIENENWFSESPFAKLQISPEDLLQIYNIDRLVIEAT